MRGFEYRMPVEGGLLVCDERVSGFELDFCSERDKDRLFTPGEGWAMILTAAGPDLAVLVELRDAPSVDDDHRAWDHVAEFSLAVRSGLLEISSAPVERPPVLRVRPGWHRVRFGYRNLATVRHEGGESRSGPLCCGLTVWPGARAADVVLKQWAGRLIL
ncbi:hypothetical protein [Paludisphaera soli]|uniref:hypothetical protein n=1 Tax=Paludisphaera soli TaxID=2712865 RepID=UPI0013EDDF63|nr:hypothetical protein [Paludisphaera soli]